MNAVDLFTPPYPYAIGEHRGGDTSIQAQTKASRNTLNDQMRQEAFGVFVYFSPSSAEDVAKHLFPKWRSRYESQGDFLQDCRRRCTELVKLGCIADSGQRAESKRNLKVNKTSGRGNKIRMWKIVPKEIP